jgi:N utilization substance protein B
MATDNDTETDPDARERLPARTRARKAAIQYLYAIDTRGERDLDPDMYFEDQQLSIENQTFGKKLARDVLDHRDEIDERIKEYAENWDLDRMSVVDRNLIRLGMAEICYNDDSPRTVVINECVELARRLGSSDSNKFVNAILDRVN